MGYRGGLLFLGVVFLAAPAAAQSTPATLVSRAISDAAPVLSGDSPAQHLAELQQWTRDYTEWKAWFLRWRNQPEPGLWSSRARRDEPVPPEWLAGACESALVDTGPLADACRAYRDWTSGNDAAQVYTQQLAQARAQLEAPTKNVWWQRIHMDALWPMTQTGSSALGVAGMHATVHVTGRFQVFMTPGIILMRAPSISGGMGWSPATDWGFSYRMFDFRMPGIDRPTTMHFNMVRVWMLGQHAIQQTGKMYLAGFSVSFKRR